MSPTEELATLAALIHDLRKHKKLTLAQLAQKIERSVGFVSQLERGLSQPTVADLTAISHALDVPTTYFYSRPRPKAVGWVTRPDERRTVYYANGITDILVSPSMNGAFSMLDSLLAPGANSGEHPMSDRAEQAGFVLEGQLTLWVEGEGDAVTLGPGDSFHLASFAQCRYANLTDLPARVLWVYN